MTTLKDIENELIKQDILTQEELNEIKHESKIKFESVNDDLEDAKLYKPNQDDWECIVVDVEDDY